jgi:pimeloyl-ACP methyl ester carboxylesterase
MGATGPKDGDPSAPVVEVPDVPCRTEADVAGGFGVSGINATVAGRELAVDYPCGKHEGAHMTVILNLHGTLLSGAPFLYQRNYFAAHRLIHSHNLVVLTPQSASTTEVGAQWGRDDGGTDLPYLNDLMNWVYTSFAKYQIRSTWVGGHSWGAGYAAGGFGGAGFVCNEMFADKFKGVIGMSRLSTPSCSERVAMIATRGAEENIPLLDQDNVAMQHGCDLPMKGPEMVGNNERFYFEGCDPGFVHEDYNMLGKGHIDSMDAEVVLKIVEAIKSTEM